ncbi:MAG: uncharacterized protein JWP08_1509, partial [Bryobacterales bacterium]|nr:uncharacterized protein [Bryobacterales bacterium]
LGILDRFASTAIAITDKRHPDYRLISSNWLQSNPRGFARWFESRAVLGREMPSAADRASRQVEEIPPYQWKTTLQRSIQLLKRHRDVMFRSAPSLAPISMIITNLSARAYSGERDLWSALNAIVNGMPTFINPTSPRVPNPSLPSEDYADKWKKDPQLEKNFRLWLSSASTDLQRLRTALQNGTATKMVEQIFGISLTVDESRSLAASLTLTRKAAPAIVLSTGQKPWASGEGSR